MNELMKDGAQTFLVLRVLQLIFFVEGFMGEGEAEIVWIDESTKTHEWCLAMSEVSDAGEIALRSS